MKCILCVCIWYIYVQIIYSIHKVVHLIVPILACSYMSESENLQNYGCLRDICMSGPLTPCKFQLHIYICTRARRFDRVAAL